MENQLVAGEPVVGENYAEKKKGELNRLGRYVGKKLLGLRGMAGYDTYLFCSNERDFNDALGMAWTRDRTNVHGSRGQILSGCSMRTKDDLQYINPFRDSQPSSISHRPENYGGKKRRSTKKRKSKRSHKRGRHTKRIR